VWSIEFGAYLLGGFGLPGAKSSTRDKVTRDNEAEAKALVAGMKE
jgi:hypothetical protein